MSEEIATEAATKILNILKQKTRILALSQLAKRAGFPGAFDRHFKAGFNLLRNEGIIKLRQSGWRSEKRRGKHNHPNTVILTADVYEIGTHEFVVDRKVIDSGFTILPYERDGEPISLNRKRRLKYRRCQECRLRPLLYVTAEKIPICEKHWEELANTNTCWS
jgi:hypothetical protein